MMLKKTQHLINNVEQNTTNDVEEITRPYDTSDNTERKLRQVIRSQVE